MTKKWVGVGCLTVGGLVGLWLAFDALGAAATTVRARPPSASARTLVLNPRGHLPPTQGHERTDEQVSPVAVENRQPGVDGWFAPRTAAPAIEGFADQISVRPGQPLILHVDSHGRAYRVEVLRLGFYGGLGARRVLCIPDCLHDRAGTTQPRAGRPDRITGEIRAHWTATDAFRVGPASVSGYYLARLVVTSGPLAGHSSMVPFIVRAPAQRRSRILVVAPVNTWQAYNGWGGKDLYRGGSRFTTPATHVSFARPFKYLDPIFSWEYPLLRFLERQGYDLSYASDVDVDRDPGLLRRFRLVVVAGHGEYWSMRERQAFDDAVDGGVNLAFMGADTGYWQIRYKNHRRTMVGYKRLPDPLARIHPQLATTRFRQLKHPPLPECELLGVMYTHGIGVAESEEPGMGPHPNIQAAVGMPSAVSSAAARIGWLAGTGLHPGSRVRVVGGEWDQVSAHCRRPVVVLHRAGHHPQDTVTYRAKSGARVFSAGSLVFLWTLDNSAQLVPAHEHPKQLTDERMQRLMCNVFSDLSSPQGKRAAAPCQVVGPE